MDYSNSGDSSKTIKGLTNRFAEWNKTLRNHFQNAASQLSEANTVFHISKITAMIYFWHPLFPDA